MKELIVDACSDILNIVLTEDGKFTGNRSVSDLRQHSVTLLPATDVLLRGRGLTIKDIDVFAVAVGSGSFTGIRVGIATVKGLCYAMKKSVKAVTTQQAAAYNKGIAGKKIGITDAKQNKVYFTAFCDGEKVCETQAVDRTALLSELKRWKGYEILSTTRLAGIDYDYVEDNSQGLIYAAEIARIISPDALIPEYVRKPQAEER